MEIGSIELFDPATLLTLFQFFLFSNRVFLTLTLFFLKTCLIGGNAIDRSIVREKENPLLVQRLGLAFVCELIDLEISLAETKKIIDLPCSSNRHWFYFILMHRFLLHQSTFLFVQLLLILKTKFFFTLIRFLK